MALIYRYVTGPEFRNRVTAIVEGFRAMKEDLESEKRALQKIWASREKQIERIISNTAGMYGDLEGLAGTALPQIKILELPNNSNNWPFAGFSTLKGQPFFKLSREIKPSERGAEFPFDPCAKAIETKLLNLL